MIGLVLLSIVAAWAGLGYLLWRSFIKPNVRDRLVRIGVTLLLALLWFVGPVADEILGAREFERLCRETPEVKFYGPVPVGPGAFFDEQGQPKWKNGDEFSAIRRNTREWDHIFASREELRILRRWPVPISESYWLLFDKRTGQPSVETFHRSSPGGWIKRVTGWGRHAPYQCSRRGRFPRDEVL